MKPTLVTLEDWPLWPERCPADVDFVDWAEGRQLTGDRIFHMGTGTHHLVGRKLAAQNFILGITSCPAEMESYMSWAIENPELSGHYQCLFGDLYVMDYTLLPKFDIITLFHLFERPDDRRAAYGARNPQETLASLITLCLAPGGRIVTYAGSATADLAKQAILDEHLMWATDHNSLQFWRAPW